MFIIVPLIIIFLSTSYIYLNQTSILTDILVYIFDIAIVALTIWLYKKVQQDLKLQEINKLKEEIGQLETKLKNSTDEQHIKSFNHKISVLKNDLNSLLDDK
jgi:septal ring factor EnvC (AmiA/AmiB activator)